MARIKYKEAAEILGCTKDMVYRALQEYGIDRHPNTRRSKLERFDLEFIRDTVNRRGTTTVITTISGNNNK